jgi:hypothetical protein
MTVRGMVRISAIGAAVLIASALASSLAHGQVPQVSIEPRRQVDTAITPRGRTPLLFGFSKQVVDATGIPVTAPARSYCALAHVEGGLVSVDSVVSSAEPELPACRPEHVPLVLRPECKLTYAEHVLWTVQRYRPVIFLCGNPPEVYLFSKAPVPSPRAEQ